MNYGKYLPQKWQTKTDQALLQPIKSMRDERSAPNILTFVHDRVVHDSGYCPEW